MFIPSDVFDYIQNTYKIRYIGFIFQGVDRYAPFYYILEKGGSVNVSTLLLQTKVPYYVKTYDKTYEEIAVYAVDDLHE